MLLSSFILISENENGSIATIKFLETLMNHAYMIIYNVFGLGKT